MRNRPHGTRPWLAAAAAAVTLVACAGPERKPPETPTPPAPGLTDEVIASVSFDGKAPVVKPDPVHIRKDKQVVHWFVYGDGTLHIDFKAQTPFASPPEEAGNHARSGRAIKEGRFAYRVTLTINGTPYVSPDPWVQVDP